METSDLNDENNMEYFESYEDMEVHELMLRDQPRNRAYSQALLANEDFIKGKVVLDVGSGTGILAVLCAQHGASKVYAVEANNIANIARKIVQENGFESVVEVIQGRIEDIDLPEKVDVIISEWMGVYLLHEGMLDSVIYARDKFLKDDGVIFPSRAVLYVAPCSVSSLFKYWDHVEGVKMNVVGKISRQRKSAQPELCVLQPEDLLVSEITSPVLDIDLQTVKPNQLHSIERDFLIVAAKDGLFQGICLWFDVHFEDYANKKSPIRLSTSSNNDPTHWKQTVIILPVDIEVETGTPIAFKLKLNKVADNDRRYTIELEILDPNDVPHPENCQCFMTKCVVTKAFLEQNELREGTDS